MQTITQICFVQEKDHLNQSEMYYAYHFIHRYVEEPFTNTPLETLLYASRFLWTRLQDRLPPPGMLFRFSNTNNRL